MTPLERVYYYGRRFKQTRTPEAEQIWKFVLDEMGESTIINVADFGSRIKQQFPQVVLDKPESDLAYFMGLLAICAEIMISNEFIHYYRLWPSDPEYTGQFLTTTEVDVLPEKTLDYYTDKYQCYFASRDHYLKSGELLDRFWLSVWWERICEDLSRYFGGIMRRETWKVSSGYVFCGSPLLALFWTVLVTSNEWLRTNALWSITAVTAACAIGVVAFACWPLKKGNEEENPKVEV